MTPNTDTIYAMRVHCYKKKMKKQFQRCSKKRGVLKNFANFMGKHLCQSLFIKKVAGPMINITCD